MITSPLVTLITIVTTLSLVGTMAILARQIRVERELTERLDCLRERMEARAASVDAMLWMADVKSDGRHDELMASIADMGLHISQTSGRKPVARHAQAS